MTEPITPQQQAADIYWQEVAPDDYELLLRANPPEDDDDDTIFLWLAALFLYVDKRSGKQIPAAAIRSILDEAILNGHTGIDALGKQLIEGAIKPAMWQLEMSRIVEQGHLAAGAAARGGWGQLTGADLSFLQGKIKGQSAYLDGFMADIISGKQPLNGNFLRRERMYGDAPRGTYEDMRGRMFTQAGFIEEGRELGRADHCPDCLAWSLESLGWLPIGTAPRLFSSICRTNCHCNFVYRDAQGNISR